jgi:hypothetical protein
VGLPPAPHILIIFDPPVPAIRIYSPGVVITKSPSVAIQVVLPPIAGLILEKNGESGFVILVLLRFLELCFCTLWVFTAIN